MKRLERVVTRGFVAGFIGATILALWFLVIDWLDGQPFRTPAFVASVLAGMPEAHRSFGFVAMYTALHYAAFSVVGIAVAWILQKLEVVPTILLGAVLGFLLFDLVFYLGIVGTGVDIVRALGWPPVLAGNVLAGIGLMAYLHTTLEAPRAWWWRTLAEHRVFREGTTAGLLGASAVAIWFLLFDLVRGRILFTPGALGSALFLGVNDLADVQVNALTVGAYTVVHLAAFVVAGIVATAVVLQAERTPAVLLGALLLFVSFEALFVGLLVVIAEWLLHALALWTIAVGNLIATAAIAGYLWKTHPDLRAALRRDLFAETEAS